MNLFWNNIWQLIQINSQVSICSAGSFSNICYGLRVTGYGVRVTGYGLRGTGC